MTTPGRLPEPYGQGSSASPADILERVLDKGVVIAGDRVREMGIGWWESDPALSSRARRDELTRENAELRERPARLEQLEPHRAREESP